MSEAGDPNRFEVESRPQWTDVLLGGNHRVTVTVIGERIVVSHPTGYTRIEDLIHALDLIHDASEQATAPGRPFVWIADYSDLEGSSREARKYFVETVKGWERLHSLIFCGLPTILTVAAKLAIKLHLVNFNVHLVNDFDEALELAKRELAAMEDQARADAPSVGDRKWTLDLDGFRVNIDVVGGKILHVRTGGRFEEQHVDKLIELQDQVLEATGLAQQPYWLLVGLDGLDSVTFKARHRYLRRISRWYEKRPFEAEVFYGANTLLRAALNLTRPFAPFTTKLVSTYDAAIELIEGAGVDHDRCDRHPEIAAEAEDGPAQIRRHVEELLHVLGAVSWDAEVTREPFEIDRSHPFAPVFDAIGLLRTELQELLEEHSRTEEEQRRLQERLARARKMEALGLLAGGVAHDLNNVLSGIVTYPDFLLMNQDLDQETRSSLEIIKRSGEQAAEIVNDLVDIARGVAVNSQPVLLDDVVADYFASPQFQRLKHLHSWVEVEACGSCGGVAVAGSHLHLQKVVMNLVSNATESIPEDAGAGRVEVETSFRSLDHALPAVEDAREGEFVVLSIRDTGPRIAAQELDRIFEPFYSRNVMGRSGTGLGLTVVWNTVQDHGGFIDVSNNDEGTRFDLYFPATRDPMQRHPEA